MTAPNKTWWHELNTWEPETALTFYSRTLGWKFEEIPLPGGAPYWIARKDGRAIGGIFGLTAPDFAGVPSHWMTYMTVPDVDLAASATVREGGEVMRAAVDVPGVGRVAVVTDATGALIGLLEPALTHIAVSYQ
jgi:predicted enzyme related to lactoylglutathione lyase